MRVNSIQKLKEAADVARILILKTGYESNYTAHYGTALSSVEILIYLYLNEMNYDLNDREWAGRDRFYLSKGHGVLSYYVALHMAGFFDADTLSTFQRNEGDLSSHPVKNLALGMEASNGSLGQGLSFAIGSQIFAVKKNRTYRSFVLMGDGECDEGSVWEAAMCASHYRLDHLMAIIDHNGLQSDGSNDDVMSLGNLESKWNSFGWETWCLDGHDLAQIDSVFSSIDWTNGKPKVIIANTVKGRGISFMENDNDWHHRQMTEKEYAQAIDELRGNRDGGQ